MANQLRVKRNFGHAKEPRAVLPVALSRVFIRAANVPAAAQCLESQTCALIKEVDAFGVDGNFDGLTQAHRAARAEASHTTRS